MFLYESEDKKKKREIEFCCQFIALAYILLSETHWGTAGTTMQESNIFIVGK
jgi:hypothetical protein